jgi:uncharacterized membrane protein
MTEPAEHYLPSWIRQRHRTQAIRAWTVTSIIVLIWLGLIVAAPLIEASPIYTFFSYLCHQQPDRSLHVAGGPMAVCSRCFGIYLGLLIGVAAYPLWRGIDETEPVSRFWLFAALIPITIDWSLTMFGIWENTHATRLITGLILGFACATFIVPAIVDIVRNLTSRRRRPNEKAVLEDGPASKL